MSKPFAVFRLAFLCRPSVRPSPGHRTEPVRANTNVFHVISVGALGTCWFWFHFVFLSCHILVFSFVSCLCLGLEPSSHACLLFSLFFSFRVYAWYHGCFPGMLQLQVIRDGTPQVATVPARASTAVHVWSMNLQLTASFHRHAFFSLFCDHGLHLGQVF